MIPPIRQSISRKFVAAVIATTMSALVIMAIAMLWYDASNFRSAAIDDLTAQADILARVSAPALEFNDPKAASENLQQIQVRPNIVAAAIYSAGGAPFAQYVKDPSVVVPGVAGRPGPVVDGNRITVVKALALDREHLGTILLAGEFPLRARVTSYATILVGVMLACLALAAAASLWLQRAITQPILSLTDVVGHVVARRDFSMRVKKSTDDEIGVLVDAFNSMLGEVGERSRALEASNQALTHETKERRDAEDALRVLNNTLEERIAARTAQLEHAHEQLRQAQKMEAIGQLTGGIAHDFNNLLAGMSGNIEMMRLRIARGQIGDLERYAKSAMASIGRAAALTHRLLAFARRQTLDPKPTDVNRLLASMEDLIRRTVGPGIRVETRSPEVLWNTLCDPNQLESALLNLAINARDAMPDGGTLTIRSSNTTTADVDDSAPRPVGIAGEYVTIEVVDTGVGMTPEVLSRVFDPFFTTKPIGQGTGLGLSMIYGFVSQSGGRIRIDSTCGAGTTVTIHLPRHLGDVGPAVEEAGPGTLASGGLRRKNVLVVDDEEAVRTNLVEMLQELGCDVSQADDGRSGLQAVHAHRTIDLLVSDVGLPNGMNGRQFADAAREVHPRMQVLFITGYANANVVGNGTMEPGMEVLTKPFTMEAFAAKVTEMLAAPAPGNAVRADPPSQAGAVA